VFLQITQPRSVVPWPMYTLLCTTARCKKAPSLITTLLPTTVNSRSSAPASTLAYSPTHSGPLSTASGSTSAPSATQTPGETSNPSISASTRPDSTSACACRSLSCVPTSSQYPSPTHPYNGAPALTSRGNPSPHQSATTPPVALAHPSDP